MKFRVFAAIVVISMGVMVVQIEAVCCQNGVNCASNGNINSCPSGQTPFASCGR